MRTEPVGLPAGPSVETSEDTLDWDTATQSPASEDVFSLLDRHVGIETFAPTDSTPDELLARPSARVDPEKLIHALHAQYCEVLASQDAGSFTMWAGLVDSDTRAESAHAMSAPELDSSRAAEGAISELFTEPQRLEEAIGPLMPDFTLADPTFDGANIDLASSPEILELFAPPEYQAHAAQRGSGVMPALARREHHALAIDSPLPVFHATASSAGTVLHEEATTQ